MRSEIIRKWAPLHFSVRSLKETRLIFINTNALQTWPM
jgi:hypothetical protein